ncbi:hypothetical protein K2173_000188 [Erythroxylum novogranatense]|uniref:NADH dehydrogenase [ubiquinone] 1 alpha subcomplex subunit 1 n=1 Tax=Erythroxylum novogranatense TaxID=1862640 RepID=A0AAV8SPL1_9ROSI|nr:hypothetical protein K2173_000188 [Erythroxylum novogranatense]
MSWIWLEAALPLGIIAGMLCVMGNAQYYIHKSAHGRVPKDRFFLVLIFDSLSTSVMICGTLLWREETSSSWKISPPIDPLPLLSIWRVSKAFSG